MKLGFEEGSAAEYVSEPQKVRSWTEAWAASHAYCPNCDADGLAKLRNNNPPADFRCPRCLEEFELKSTKAKAPKKIPDGAHQTMLAKLHSDTVPNLMLLTYDRASAAVSDLSIVPKHFFTPAMIEPRRALGPGARRAGWIGCNILLEPLPAAGKIFLVRGGDVVPKDDVRRAWREMIFLRQESVEARGWLVEVLKCVESIGRAEFTLEEVYAFEPRLRRIYPENAHVREKMRQQLQVLRDKGILEFRGRGSYRLKLQS